VKKLEATTLIIGAALVVLSVLAVDWRLGFGLLGLFLILSSLDIKLRRRT